MPSENQNRDQSNSNSLSGLTICVALYSFDIGGSERLGLSLCQFYLNKGAKVVCCATRRGLGVIADELATLGVDILALDLDRKSRIRKVFSRLRLALWLRIMRVTFVHVHHFCVLRDLYWPSKLVGIRHVIVTEHTASEVRNDLSLQSIILALAPKVSKVTAINPDIAAAIREVVTLNEEHITVIENGVDTSQFSPRPNVGTERQLNITWVGRLHPDKDINTALEAIMWLSQNVDEQFIFNVIGAGQDLELAKEFVSKNNLDGLIAFKGEVNDVQSELGSADIFLMSSMREGTPLVLLEAMSCGLPVVATAVGGIPETVADDCALLTQPEDFRQLGEGLKRLVLDKELRQKMGVSARARAVARYSDEAMGSKYIQLIREIGQRNQS